MSTPNETDFPNWPGAAGAILALAGVAAGAFGAHALAGTLAETGGTETWGTAADYHLWHALALCVLGAGPLRARATAPAVCFIAGIALFPGSLYWLALGGPAWLGPVTPAGGLSLMVGWALTARAFLWKGR